MLNLKRIYIKLILIFLIIFPKGGFKIGDIPITWGYLLLLFSIPLCLLKGLKYINRNRFRVFILTLPFIIYSSILLILRFNSDNLGFTLSFCLSILFLPFIFLILYSKILDSKIFNDIFPFILLWGIRIVIVFGLFLFLYKKYFNQTFEIPYLTVNIDDDMEQKNNNRQGITKLYSTYNNGNIYGICMHIITPLYLMHEKKNIFKVLFLLTLFLTLSRTIWIGVLIEYIFFFINSFLRRKNIFLTIISGLALISGFPYLLSFMNKDVNFIMDKDLGGRLYLFDILNNISLFGSGSFRGISEIVYLSIIQTFGLVGFILFLLYLFAPIIIFNFTKTRNKLYLGLLTYIFLCMSDGAILLIPVMCFYWFVSSYMFKKKL